MKILNDSVSNVIELKRTGRIQIVNISMSKLYCINFNKTQVMINSINSRSELKLCK